MMRWATSHTASIALTISCLPTTVSSSRLKLRRHTRVDRISLFENAEQRQSGLGGHGLPRSGGAPAIQHDQKYRRIFGAANNESETSP
jgi:hypothetical protein